MTIDLINFAINSMHKLILVINKPKAPKVDPFLEEIEMIIKRSPSPSNDFMKDFDTDKTHNVFVTGATSMKIERVRETPPMPMNSHTVDLLKQSIVISIPFTTDRSDLEFIAFSRIDHQPIYRYIGNDFSKFDLPYTEIVSVERNMTERIKPRKPTPPKSQSQSGGWIGDYTKSHGKTRN